MQEQDIKRGHYKNIEGEKLGELINEIFGDYKKEDDTYLVEFGALQPFKLWIQDKATLCIETIMNPEVDEATAIDTRQRYNKFMESVTGFNSKERSKRLKKKAKEGKL